MLSSKLPFIIFVFLLICTGFVSAVFAEDIHIAVERGSVDAVKAALEEKPQVINLARDDGMMPLHIAAKAGYIEIVDLLLAAGADVHAKGKYSRTALGFAMFGRHYEVVKHLIKAGAIERKEDAQSTLRWAATFDAEIIEILIAAGVDVNSSDRLDRTSLHYAGWYKQAAAAELLIKSGADVNALDREGSTPLMIMCKWDPEEEEIPAMVEIARMLLRAGADPSITDEDDWTVLHFAVWFDLPDLVKLFVDEGLDTGAKDRRNKTPLDLARIQKFKRIIAILKAAE